MSHILEFLDLVDAPSTYTDKGGFWVVVNSGATALEFVTKTLADTAVSLSGSHTGLLNGEASVADAMVALDDLDDSDIPLAGQPGAHTQNLSLETTLGGAMTVLDNLDEDNIRIDGTYTGWLTGDTDLGDVLDTVDGLTTGGVTFDNDVFGLKWANKLDTGTILGWKVNTDDDLEAGVSVVIPNADYLLGRNAADTANAYLIGLNASNIVSIGSGTFQTSILSGANLLLGTVAGVIECDSSIQLNNTLGLNIEDSGGTSRNAVEITSGDVLNVGNSACEMNLISDGLIDAGANDIETTGEVIADTVDARHLRGSHTKTLTLGGATTIAQLVIGTAPAGASATFQYEIEVKDSSDVQVEGGLMTFTGSRVSGGQSGSGTKSGTTQDVTAGTLTVTAVVYTATAGLIICRFNVVTTGLTTPTGEARVVLIGNADRNVNWI